MRDLSLKTGEKITVKLGGALNVSKVFVLANRSFSVNAT